jgi:hypothetical protein
MPTGPIPFSFILVPERGHENCSENAGSALAPIAQRYGILAKIPGSVPFSMKGVVTSSVRHHQQEAIGDPVKAVHPSRKGQDR